MNGMLYRGVVIQARDSADGETHTCYIVTEEANGFAIWRESAEEGVVLIKHEKYAYRDKYIEEAAALAMREREIAKTRTFTDKADRLDRSGRSDVGSSADELR